MKMYFKYLLSAASLIAVSLGASPAYAQLTSGSTIMTVTVVDVLALTVNVPAVPMPMGTITEYQDGTGFTAPAQLLASSNLPYDIKVKSDGDLVGTLTATGSSIPINNIMVQTSPTAANTFGSTLNLSAAEQVLISNAPAGMAKSFDVKYSTAAANQAFFVKGGAYVATLTYSISAH